MYDIYLNKGCASTRLAELQKHVPHIPQQTWLKIQERHPGFLEVDLHQSDAISLMKALRRAGARGRIVPTAYREPRLSIEEALRIAVNSISIQEKERFPGYSFNEVKLIHDDVMWWVFSSVSEKLVEEGFIPGALHAYVDKIDGHIWGPEELERLSEHEHAI